MIRQRGKQARSRALFIACFIIAAFGLSLSVQASEFEFSAGAQYRLSIQRRMTEDNGSVPADQNYRVSGERYLAQVGCRVYDKFDVGVLLGMSDLTTHSDGGRTAGFDAGFAFGMTASAVPLTLPDHDLSFATSLDFLYCGTSNGRTTTGCTSCGDDLGFTWYEAGVSVVCRHHAYRHRVMAGVRYLNVWAEQERTAAGVTATSDFDADKQLGVILGVEYDVTESLLATFEASFVDESAFEFGVRYTF